MTQAERHEHLYALVSAIPAGTTTSYGALARAIPGASARSVAKALSRLPADTHLPWHRVIRSDGQLPQHAGRQEQRARLVAEGIDA